MVVSKIDEYGKGAWLALVIAAFWLAWPIALMLLAFLYGSGRIQAWRSAAGMPGQWFNLGRTPFAGFANGAFGFSGRSSSGNAAFDDYREATLRTLEEEEKEFHAFLERLRKARDKSEFDAFMAERRPRTPSEPEWVPNRAE